jgi:hypothetical protein
MTPSWILDIFAGLMLVVAAVSVGRLGVAQPWRHGAHRAALADIDVAHLLMAIAMAGMLAASLQTLPNGAWEVIFGVLTVWFAYRVARDFRVSGGRALAGGHCGPHLIHAAAMLYMFLALTAPAAHGSGVSGMGGAAGGMGTLSLPLLAFIFALALIGYGVWDLDQLSGPGATGHYSLAVARVASASPVLASVGAGASSGGPADVQVSSVVTAEAPATGPAQSAESCGPASGTGRGILAPWVATSSRIAMGVTMALMLLLLI